MKKTLLIRLGDFLFKHRNYLFPAVIVCLIFLRPPVADYFGNTGLEEIKDQIAISIVVFGLAIRAFVIGFAYIKRGGMNKQVYADTLVVNGIFGLCRNPLYVGNILVYIGIFLMHGDFYILAFGIPVFIGFYIAIVAAEEFFLHNKFGSEYENYCKEVPRWLPRFSGIFSRFKALTKDMNYNFRRVLTKDYTTIINAAIPIIIIEYYENIILAGTDKIYITAVTLTILLSLGFFALVIKRFKKRASV